MNLFFVAVCLFFAFICYACCSQIRSSHQRQMYILHIAATRIAAQPPPASTGTTTSGLDRGIIDAIPSVTLGEDGRMTKEEEDEKTCSICLSEYQPNEKLKTLPQCLHGFHSDCIDQWLQSSGTCPICRVPPPPHHES